MSKSTRATSFADFRLKPALRGVLNSQAIHQPTPIQAEAIPVLLDGQDVIGQARTGSGKTLAAFLWSIDRLASEPIPDEQLRRCRVVYISPLKALAVDVERNLRAPLTGIRHAAARLGLPVPDSSWDSVDLAIPARRANSVSDSPDRRRSRRSEAAMTSSGALSD